ncbi:retrovirus-related pol polyprotein from transposon TNT 1-94 [Tanacetum coccineum]
MKHLKDQLRENSKCVTIPDCKAKVPAPGRYPIDVKPIPPRLKKNRGVHLHYIERLKENVETLHKIVRGFLALQNNEALPGRLLPLGRQCPLVRSTALKSDCLPADPQETIAPVAYNLACTNQPNPNCNWGSNDAQNLMTGVSASRIRNFVENVNWIVRFGNDTFGCNYRIWGLCHMIPFKVAFRIAHMLLSGRLRWCLPIKGVVNGVVERRNRTLVKVARAMLLFSKAPLFLWAEAVATACYTQN